MSLPPLGAKTIAGLFARRHESPELRAMARAAIRDGKLWLQLFGSFHA